MMNLKTTTVKLDGLRKMMEGMLAAAGCDAETAKALADLHLEADMRGVGVQGLSHLVNSHIPHLRNGKIDPAGKPKIVRETDTSALIDGNNGPGPIAGVFAADLAARKAKKAGIAAVGVVNSNDMFIIGYFADRMAEAGAIALVFSDDEVCGVHPIGGADPVIGTNPMAIAVPTDEEPFVHDFTPTAYLPTYTRYAKRYGVAIPEGSAVDAEGRPTVDPKAVWGSGEKNVRMGAISPLGNKGYGLLLAIDFLSGALVGCDMGTDHESKKNPSKGHAFIALDAGLFVTQDQFRRAVSGRIRKLKGSRTAPGVREIRVPGERSHQSRKRAIETGEVTLDRICWEDAKKLARELGVATPA